MYVAGDRVLYGSHGVCRVTALEQRKIDRKMVTYLALSPEGQPGASYLVPTHNPAAMAKLSPILSREAMDALLASGEIRHSDWIEDSNQRKAVYRETLCCGDRVRLLQMICALYRHTAARLAEGKKFHQSDDGFLRDAEKLICSEISCVMELDMHQARAYLKEALDVQQKDAP